MLSTRRIFKDHDAAGSLNSLIALWGFVDDETFLTKAGHVGLVYRLAGVDAECLDVARRQEIVHRYEAALRSLDQSCRVYQYLTKRRMPALVPIACRQPVVHEAVRRRAAYLNGRRDDLYVLDLHLVLVYEGLRLRASAERRLRDLWTDPAQMFKAWLSPRATLAVVDADLRRAVTRLHQIAAGFDVHLADSVGPRRLAKADAFVFFRRLVNYTARYYPGAALQYDTHLDYFVADSSLECHRDHLTLDTAQVKVLTMKEPPSATFPQVLEDLAALPGELIACVEWCRIPSDQMRRNLRTRQRHFFNKRVSMVNYVSPETRPDEMLVDESASATVRQLGDAMTAMEVDGHFFGECSLSLVLISEDARALERSAAEAVKVLASHDWAFIDETYNLLNAWLAIVPGNSAHNLRRLPLLETNYADLSLLFTRDTGQARSPHLQAEALAVLETQHQTPYHFNLHVEDVGHTLVLGATGSGKSFLLNFLVMHAQKYEPVTVIFDLGHSYRKLATLLDGSYLALGLQHQDMRINPFALEPTPDHIHFLHAFVRVLVEGADTTRLSEAEDRELYEAIENLYVLDPAQRRLFTLANLLPRAMASRLSKWVEGGRYADLFDHVDDTFHVQPFQVFDFEAMRAYPALLEPLLFYVLHRVGARLASSPPGTFTLCVMDEAWRFIQHETLRTYVQEALKTWRKRNAAMLLATQAADDFVSADLLRTVVESCPTKLLLANPALDRRQYADLFQLNETELDLVAGLQPRRQLLVKRPGGAKVLTLATDPRSYWLYTNTPVDNARVRAAFAQYGFEGGLDQLVAST